MKNLRRFVFVFGCAVLPPTATGLVFVSCGGDDTTGPNMSSDGGQDGTMPDVVTMDVGPDNATRNDAAPDAAPDVTTDAPTTVDADAGALDAGFDVAQMLAFPGQVATALCDRTAVCCGFSGLDASAFNATKCINSSLPIGFKGSSFGSDLLDSGRVTFNASKAQSCLSQLAAIDCVTNQLTSAVDIALYANCFGALIGTLPVDASCAGSIECAPGEFCDPVEAGADASVCRALRTANQVCSDFYPNPDSGAAPSAAQLTNAQSACSYRGSGDTNLACAYLDSTTFGYLYPAVCVAAGPLDAGCVSDQECTSKTCSVPSCVQAERFITPATCTADTIPDAGGGG
jgi:hypothetical protein